MQFHPNELYLYYDPGTSSGKMVRAYSRSVNNNINDFNIHRVRLTTTIWKDILNILELRPKDLLDKSHPEYQEKIRGNKFTMTGWLDVLVKNPHLIKAPIAIHQGRAVLCIKPTDVLKLERNRSIRVH
jgi:arsenate reductase